MRQAPLSTASEHDINMNNPSPNSIPSPNSSAPAAPLLAVRAAKGEARGVLSWASQNSPAHEVPCALGAAGIRAQKREGDEATPSGRFTLRGLWYRPDRFELPDCKIAARAITPQDGWSDDPTDPAYNRPICRPYEFAHEELWRDDHLYDVFIEIGYNDAPPQAGLGSAIFLHLQKNNFQPTRGCVAINIEDMQVLIPCLRPNSMIDIQIETPQSA